MDADPPAQGVKIARLITTCRWVAEHRGLLVTGPCGVGKSWLSCALAQKACRDGYTALFLKSSELFRNLATARADVEQFADRGHHATHQRRDPGHIVRCVDRRGIELKRIESVLRRHLQGFNKETL